MLDFKEAQKMSVDCGPKQFAFHEFSSVANSIRAPPIIFKNYSEFYRQKVVRQEI